MNLRIVVRCKSFVPTSRYRHGNHIIDKLEDSYALQSTIALCGASLFRLLTTCDTKWFTRIFMPEQILMLRLHNCTLGDPRLGDRISEAEVEE